MRRLAQRVLRALDGRGVEVLDDAQGCGEDARLHDLQLDGRGLVVCWQALGEALGVDLGEGEGELAADGDPFAGFEVVVLEEEEQGGGVQERGVLAEELGFAEFSGFEGGGLGGWMAGFELGDGGRWDEGGGGYRSCGGRILAWEEGGCDALGAEDGADHLRGWL